MPGADGPIAGAALRPALAASAAPSPAPLLVFIHGGGMMFGDLDTHDATCRLLAERADVRVLAVDYRLAPEHPFPAAVEDCWAAYQWVAEHAETLGADPERIAVGGDSAGGYLVRGRPRSGPPRRACRCAFQLLVYPVTEHGRRQREPAACSATGFYLDQPSSSSSPTTSYLTAGRTTSRDPLVSVHFTEKIPDGPRARRSSSPPGSTRCATRGRPTRGMLADAGVRVELQALPGPDPRVLQHRRRRAASSRAAVAEIAAKLKAALHGLRDRSARGAYITCVSASACVNPSRS